jgi:glc operon protein GlcG
MRQFLLLLISVTVASTAAAEGLAVRHLPAGEVSSAFAKGAPLIETGSYKIHASRREGPGQAEVHTTDTDIIYVLEGEATLVTGGVVQGATSIGPNEIRGAAVEGGTPRRLVKGDVVVVPYGVPHWFQQVDGPFLYYVVKVTEGTGGTR